MGTRKNTDKARAAPPARARQGDEIEIAYYTKELGRDLQRKMLQGRLDDFSHSGLHGASHGEDTEAPRTPPREDRAG
ncbi:hypothetical protein [Caenimonas aquaedulcis]|uniref:Uncharacterized protein n=1 Tax=Caenimonas aquaedulcis TaxID=2793270 RepID=A0A931H5C9_9BURK|nr:hypothetical protein [Caenimonas aquaedulcis]MBG9388941.1 hypothetical protein [Caenimonas aquaedulcis]